MLFAFNAPVMFTFAVAEPMLIAPDVCFDCWCGFVSHDSYANKLRGFWLEGLTNHKGL